MLKPILNLFNLTEERAEELFLLFLDAEGERADNILSEVEKSDLTLGEKMFMTYTLGILSAMQSMEGLPSETSIFKTKTYVH
jgi:hypothetical protein